MFTAQPNVTTQENSTFNTECQLTLANYFLVFGYIAVIIIGVIGNILVVIIFQVDLKKRPTIDLLIFYLAIFDGLGSFFGPFVFLYWTLTCHKRWDFGWFGCKTLPTFSRVMTNISTGVILIMAVDRCRSIIFPFKRRFRKLIIHMAIIITVLISVVWESYYISSLHIDIYQTCNTAAVNNHFYAYPLITLVAARSIIFISVFSMTTFAVYIKLHNCERLVFLKNNLLNVCNKNKIVMKILIMMASVFILSVVPRDIYVLYYTISWLPGDGGIYGESVINVNHWLRLLQTSNGIYNVFIYGKMHDYFWKSLQRMLNCRLQSSRESLLTLEKTRRVTESQNMKETEFGGMMKVTPLLSSASQNSLKVLI
ncbi:formyl peptide receptor 2 [Hydra vulgaris]|uniref:formyl peptide receptor 2 n=1 Tax=Hydra vulgaris TaxID=6087 RepID=UPI001F5EB389|nr:formyl peptide receptor 2-like [Hydra vulgaris]